MFGKWGALFITVLGAIILAALAITPPSSQGADIAEGKFSSSRAMADINIIAARPHPTGSEDNARVRDYLTQRLTELGVQAKESEAQLDERSLKRLNGWSGQEITAQPIYNIIGVLPGQDRTKPALLLMAHHDTVWGSPGAADDTVGLASILEILRAVKTTNKQKRDLIILFTDAEELGLVGARHFFKTNPLADRVGAVINFEARGGGGTANMFQTSANNGAAVRLYARAVNQPSTSSLSTFVYSILPNDTDLTPALEKDYTAYNIANIGRARYYHSPKIDATALEEGTLQHMGAQGLDLTLALLSAEALPVKESDATFFDLFGIFTLIYAPFWGWVFLTIGGLCYAMSAHFKTDRKAIMDGLTRMLGFLLLGGVMLFGLNRLSGGGASADYYDRLAAIPKLEGLAFVTCLALFIAFFGRKTLSANGRLGAVIPIFALGVLGQIYAPTATYFISLPIMLCGAVSLLIQKAHDTMATKVIAIIIGAVVLGYMLGLGHLLMLGIGPDMLFAAILPAALGGIAILPLYAGLSKHRMNLIIMSGLGMAAVIAIWIRFDPIAATIPLY